MAASKVALWLLVLSFFFCGRAAAQNITADSLEKRLRAMPLDTQRLFMPFAGKQNPTKKLREQQAEILLKNRELADTLAIVENKRRKSEKLLLNILPKETADELKRVVLFCN